MTLRHSLLLALCVSLTALFVGLVDSATDTDLLPYEPVQYLRAQLAPSQATPLTELIGEATPTEAADFISRAKVLLKSHLAKSGTSVVLVKGERVMVQRRTKGLQWDSEIELPSTNTMSLMSMVLPILLENYKASMINDPIGKVLKGNDRTHPLVSGRELMNFLDILNKLPSSSKSVNLDSPSLLRGLLANGELSIHFVNAVLDNAAQEAWMDALMALGSTEIKRKESGQIVMDLNSLLQFSLTVIHDLKMMGMTPRKERLPLDNNKYLFGWWFNCLKDSSTTDNCLIPNAPADTIFSISPELRMYVTPSLELTVIVVGPGASSVTRGGRYEASKKLDSVADILVEDAEIWRLFSSSVASSDDEGISQSEAPSDPTPADTQDSRTEAPSDPTPIDTQPEEVAEFEETDEDTGEQPTVNENADLIELIHRIWPIIVFLFWVTASHVWVYWLLHGFWFLMTTVSRRAHIPRPKTAAEPRN